MAANEQKRKYFDSRVSDRYVKKGVIAPKEFEAYVKALPDDEANCTFVEMDLHDTELSSEEDADSEDEG